MEEDKLQDEFMDFWDLHKKRLGLGKYSDEILHFWLKKMEDNVEHCDEPDCPACNKAAYERGREDERKAVIGESEL